MMKKQTARDDVGRFRQVICHDIAADAGCPDAGLIGSLFRLGECRFAAIEHRQLHGQSLRPRCGRNGHRHIPATSSDI